VSERTTAALAVKRANGQRIGTVMRPVHSPPVLRTARMGHPRYTNSEMVGMGAPSFVPCEGWGTERISGTVMRPVHPPPVLRTARMGHPRRRRDDAHGERV
jgi:hypothetical protein